MQGIKALALKFLGSSPGSTLWLWASNPKFASVRACEDEGHNHSNSPNGTIVS